MVGGQLPHSSVVVRICSYEDVLVVSVLVAGSSHAALSGSGAGRGLAWLVRASRVSLNAMLGLRASRFVLLWALFMYCWAWGSNETT